MFALAGFAFASCNGDYDDWANPQHNGPENAITIPGFAATATGAVDLANAGEQVKLFTLSEAALPENTALKNSRIILTPADESLAQKMDEQEVSASSDGNVQTADLQAAIVTAYGSKPAAREFKGHVYSDVVANGQALLVDAGEITVVATPQAPFIDNAYYLVGSLDDWSKQRKDEYKLVNGGGDPYSDPVFSVIIPSPGDVTVELKVVPQSGFKADGSDVESWDNVLSATPDNAEGKFSYKNEGGNITFKASSKFSKYKLEFNMLEGTYTVTGLKDPKLYLTGSNYNWGNGGESSWKPLVRVNGSETDFWTIIYLHADEQFKFAPQADWGNDFGGEAQIVDDGGAGITVDGTNLKVGKAGWYLLHVTNGDNRVVRVLKPNVYLQGNAIGNWDCKTENLFSVPADENGEFVSPPFVSGTDELRMCVNLGTDWWKTEFMVFDGKIAFRGNGIDQKRVSVTAGKRVYLNFKNNTGEIK